jgi:hypothetical protein
MEIRRAGSQASTKVQEQLDGKPVEWMEHVTDDQYLADRNSR